MVDAPLWNEKKDALVAKVVKQNAETREKEGKPPLTEEQTKLLTKLLDEEYGFKTVFDENFRRNDAYKEKELQSQADKYYTSPEKIDKLPEIVAEIEAKEAAGSNNPQYVQYKAKLEEIVAKQEEALAAKAATAGGLEVKQVPVGTMGLKQDAITGDLLKPDQAPAVVKDGEFKLPEAVAQQALDAVKKLGQKGEVRGMEEAAFLDGNFNDLTDKEKAAMLLAKSAKIDVSPDGKVTTTIDGKLTPEKFLEADGKNPDAIFEAAKLILAKTYGVEGGVETKGPEGQQAFVQAAKTPPATERTR